MSVAQFYDKAKVDSLLTAHTTLTPVYSDTPMFRWTYSDVPDGWIVVTPPRLVTDQEILQYYNWMMEFFDGDATIALYSTSTIDSNEVVFENKITATRTRTDIIGYTLSEQTDKPLATAAQGAKADAAYQKPSGGIPVADLAPAVQTSLQKADDALSRAEAEAGFTEWSLEDGATPSGLQLSDQPYIARDGDETYWAVPLVGMGYVRIGGTPADTDATSLSWHGQREGFEVSFTTTRTRLRPTAAQEAAWTNKVWEYAASSAFPVTGVENRIYVDKSTNLTYRWDATSNSYVQIGGSSIDVDDAINATSTNPVQNGVIATALSGKANSAALADPFDSSKAYPANSYVTHDGLMYKCASSVSAGAWNASSWTQVDLMAPDATFDVLADGRLRISNSSGTELWSQGYALASPSDLPTTTLSCDKVNYYAFATTEYTAFSNSTTYAKDVIVVYNGKVYKCETAVEEPGAWTGSTNWTEFLVSATFTLPKAGSGKVGDFILDVSNANNYEVHVSPAGTLGTDYDAIVPRGESLAAILTVPASGLAEFYFTMTAFGTAAKPAWKVVRQLVEKETAQS